MGVLVRFKKISLPYLVILLLLLAGCRSYKETNPLAVPSLFKEEYETYLQQESQKSQKKTPQEQQQK